MCGRCRRDAPRDLRSKDAEDWNAQWRKGELVLLLCPSCQTPEEFVEAEVNAAELRAGVEDGGQFVADPVICMTGSVNDGTVLYGHDHLKRVVLTGQAANLQLVERLPEGTRCVATVGGVMIYLPRQLAAG
jgi:hypothetical protein